MATFYNQATLSYNGFVTNSNITEGELVAAVSATKTAISESYGAGAGISYVISIVNTSNATLTGVTVTDDLGTYTQGGLTLRPLDYVDGSVRLFINGVLVDAPEASVDGVLTFSGISIPAGAAAMLIYQTRANEFAPIGQGASITNTATVGGTGCGEITASATVNAEESISLTIAKAISPDTVSCGEELSYTFIIQNTGNLPADAGTAIAVADIFNPSLSGISVTLNGGAFPATSYTYDEESGSFATAPGAITVPAATYTQNTETGVITTTPGVAILTVSGTVGP